VICLHKLLFISMQSTSEQNTTPSIPSRFKPPKRKRKPEQKGFGSTDKRFQTVLSEVPGMISISDSLNFDLHMNT